MPRSWAKAESTKYRAFLAGTLFFPWACTRATSFSNAKAFTLNKTNKTYTVEWNFQAVSVL
jgi:hypothetical protein